MCIVYRPLLFSSLDEQVAQAKGVRVGIMNALFMTILAGVITIAVPAVGTLLIFALVVTPAATSMIITDSPFKAIVMAMVLCLVSIWGGLVISTMFPPSEFRDRHVVHTVLGHCEGRRKCQEPPEWRLTRLGRRPRFG